MNALIRTATIVLATTLIISTAVAQDAKGETENKAAATQPAQLTVEQIVHKTNYVAYYQGRDGSAKVDMTIVDPQNRRRTRQFTILRRDAAKTDDMKGNAYWSEQSFYVYFHKPADIAKTVFMVHKKLDRDDDRWLYLPALDLVKRIAATDKRTSFMGSDFFYEDVSGRSIDLDKHELLKTTSNYYVLKNTPKDPKSVEFSHYIMYVHKKSFIPVQTTYYDANNKPARVYTARKVETIQGYPTITQSTMENLKTGTKTFMTYADVKYDIDLDDSVFTERRLRNAPKEVQ